MTEPAKKRLLRDFQHIQVKAKIEFSGGCSFKKRKINFRQKKTGSIRSFFILSSFKANASCKPNSRPNLLATHEEGLRELEGSDVYISEAYRSKVENLRKSWIHLSLCIEKATLLK